MRRIIISFIVASLILTVFLIYLNSKISLCRYSTIFNIIGTVYTVLAFIFALLASLYAKQSRDAIINTFLREFFELSPEEQNIFFQLSEQTNGGRIGVLRDTFSSNLKDSGDKDVTYWINKIIEKENWIVEKNSELHIHRSKFIIANNLRGYYYADK